MYLIVKVGIRISSPALVNVVLRKRISVRVYNRQGLKDSLRRLWQHGPNVPTRCGVRFIVLFLVVESEIKSLEGELENLKDKLSHH